MESRDIVLKIVENWGNAMCPIGVMEGWIKEYASLQTQHLTDEIARLKGELEEQTKLKQQWYNLYQNALRHNI